MPYTADYVKDTTAEGSVHTSPGNGDPEIGLLALNATGELKYLGPSSGSFFSNYAASLVRGCATSRGRPPQGSGTDQESGSLEAGNARELVNDSTALKPDEVQFLLTSYELWIHPLYPLFRLETLRDVVAKCIERQGSVVAGNAISADFEEQMPVFYMIMALGAMNQASTHKHMQQSPGLGAGRIRGDFSPKLFYALALRYFDFEAKSLRPSVSSIRMILLICVYSTSGSIGSSQWQLSGLAMRVSVLSIGKHGMARR